MLKFSGIPLGGLKLHTQGCAGNAAQWMLRRTYEAFEMRVPTSGMTAGKKIEQKDD